MIQAETAQQIDGLIRQEVPFALWRIAGEEEIHCCIQRKGNPEIYHRIEDLNGKSGFVIAPFSPSEQHPIVVIRPDDFTLPEPETAIAREIREVQTTAAADTSQLQADYTRHLEIFLRALNAGDFSKLVLSRQHVLAADTPVSIGEAFCKAVKRYVYSYVYLCFTPQTGIWMGCTPEILLAGEQGKWQTVALAGTQRLTGGKLPQQWDEKNRREQQLVAAYIQEQLAALQIGTEEKGPFTVRAGELAHLKSEFHFELTQTDRLGHVLEVLHPTPAVCGSPKPEAYQFICRHEGYDRSYYSGFVGWLDPEGRTDLYVNLRCMNCRDNRLTFYAGGGILPSSVIRDEWRETEDKMQTMKRLFGL